MTSVRKGEGGGQKFAQFAEKEYSLWDHLFNERVKGVEKLPKACGCHIQYMEASFYCLPYHSIFREFSDVDVVVGRTHIHVLSLRHFCYACCQATGILH